MAAAAPIGVVLVEDNEVFRESLELMLEATPDIRVVASVPDGEAEALAEAGAVACLTKDRQLDEIVGAIRDAAGRGAALR